MRGDEPEEVAKGENEGYINPTCVGMNRSKTMLKALMLKLTPHAWG